MNMVAFCVDDDACGGGDDDDDEKGNSVNDF